MRSRVRSATNSWTDSWLICQIRLARPKAIATRQFRQFQIRFLEQERGTRGGAAPADGAPSPAGRWRSLPTRTHAPPGRRSSRRRRWRPRVDDVPTELGYCRFGRPACRSHTGWPTRSGCWRPVTGDAPRRDPPATPEAGRAASNSRCGRREYRQGVRVPLPCLRTRVAPSCAHRCRGRRGTALQERGLPTCDRGPVARDRHRSQPRRRVERPMQRPCPNRR